MLPEILTAAITPSARGAAAAQKYRNGKRSPLLVERRPRYLDRCGCRPIKERALVKLAKPLMIASALALVAACSQKPPPAPPAPPPMAAPALPPEAPYVAPIPAPAPVTRHQARKERRHARQQARHERRHERHERRHERRAKRHHTTPASTSAPAPAAMSAPLPGRASFQQIVLANFGRNSPVQVL